MNRNLIIISQAIIIIVCATLLALATKLQIPSEVVTALIALLTATAGTGLWHLKPPQQ